MSRRELLVQLTPWLRTAAIAAASVSLLLVLFLQRLTALLNADLWVNRVSVALGLIAIAFAIAAILGGGLSRPWMRAMALAILLGLVAVVHGAWIEFIVYVMARTCFGFFCGNS